MSVCMFIRVKDVLMYDIQIRTHLNYEFVSSVFVVHILDGLFFCFAFIERNKG